MKKYTAILMLTAATSLAACSHQGNYNNEYGYQNTSSANTPEYAENTENADRSHWQQDRQAKINVMVDELFNKCDTNGDGYISWKEYEHCAHRMFRDADTNHDGKLSRHEVYMHKLHMMHKMHEKMEENRGDDDSGNMSYNNTGSSSATYASGSGTRSYRDESSYQDLTPAAGEESEGVNDNGYSNNSANVNRYNETH